MASAIGGGPLLVSAGKPVFRAQRVVRRPGAEPPGAAQRGRTAERRADPARNRRRRRLRVQRGHDELRARSRARAARRTDRDGPRHRHVGRDGLRRHAAHPRRRAADLRRAPALLQRCYAAPLASTTLSPNGDGVDDIATFTYKLVRPSQVTATVVGPDRSSTHARPGLRAAGRAHAAVGRERRRRGQLALLGDGNRRSRPRHDRGTAIRAQPDARRSLQVDAAAAPALDGDVPARASPPSVTVTVEKGRTASSSRPCCRRSSTRGRRRVTLDRAAAAGYRGRGSSRRTPSARRRFSHRSPLAPLVDLPPVLAGISSSFTSQIASHGVYAVFVLMLVDAVFPAASELVMLYAGPSRPASSARPTTSRSSARRSASASPRSSSWRLPGTFGYLVGALIGWRIGLRGGRPLLERRGRWLHVTPDKLDRAERWFDRWGNLGVFLGRHHARHPLVRLDPGRASSGCRSGRTRAARCVGSAIWAFGIAGVGYGARLELRALPPRLPLRRVRGRGRRSCCSRRISSIGGAKAAKVRRRDDPAR